MATITDGGPAFPHISDRMGGEGMSLRDYFATKALQGWIATDVLKRIMRDEQCVMEQARNMLAEACYLMADAMLRARATVSPYNRDTARACRGAQSPADAQAEHLKEFGK